MKKQKEYYSADEATKRLNVTKGTLYSYVSRGLIRSEKGHGKTRERLYLASDVNALLERRQQRKNPERAAKAALSWGAPVLESALTSIAGGKLYYRGQDATELAVKQTLEEIAGLLWLDDAADHASMADIRGNVADNQRINALADVEALIDSGLKMPEAFQIVLSAIGASDLAAYSATRRAVAQTGGKILKILTATVVAQAPPQKQGARQRTAVTGEHSNMVAQALQHLWVADRPEAEALLNAALILSADHELNVSSFTVRCVASAGSSPYAAVIAGLSALQGHRHGGQSELVEKLLSEIEALWRSKPAASLTSCARSTIVERLKRGELIPGFGHPLYPDGDPRCTALLELTRQFAPKSEQLAVADSLMHLVSQQLNSQPNLDFGLAVLSHVLKLPTGAPLTLFALGRTVGWIGHYIEQMETGQLIRPRATYIGAKPVTPDKETTL